MAGNMADDSNANVPSQPGASSREVTGGVKPPTSWVLPLITAVVLASAFCAYYFVYVKARREYLANRNFRSLAVLGDQIQAMVSIHGSILEFSADLADPTRNDAHREKEHLKQFVVIRPEDIGKDGAEQDREALKDYLKYLAPSLELPPADETHAKPLKRGSRLEVQRRNGRWELVLTADRHGSSHKEYVGSLELSGVLKPLVGSLPFDDILLVSEDGTIVYQSNKAGPQFTTLTGLLQAQAGGADDKPTGSAAETKPTDSGAETKPLRRTAGAHSGPASKHDDQETGGRAAVNQNADQAWRNKSMHLTDLVLAGTRYKLFLQPVLVDAFTHDPNQDEPAQEWVVCGLTSATTLEWEALSISSTFMVWLTALFLVVFMSAPVLKVLFINRREHLRLRELGFLGFLLVLLTSVFTLSGLNAVGFPLNDDTEEQLERLGNRLSKNIHDELRQMRDQLQDWCKNRDSGKDLKSDLESVEKRNRRVIRSNGGTGSSRGGIDRPPTAAIYPYLNNVFWTNDDGQQMVKWSASRYLTPMIDVSKSRLYKGPRSTYLDGNAPAFRFDSVMPLNKLEYLADLTMSTRDCNPNLFPPRVESDVAGGSAFLTAQPLSLIDPILPFGYGFALVDETGLVLFHVDKTKNLHENFLQESDWSKQLNAAMFGHSTQRSLTVKYLGNDYQARVMPVIGVSQAPWSLIVFRDPTSVRTLNLQSMTMASTLLLVIFAVPAIAIAIWCAIRQPKFAPEWLWPNQARMSTYVYQIVIYTWLIILFLFLGFTGSSEQNVIACAALPYTAFLLTAWCIRACAPRREKLPARGVRRLLSGLVMILTFGAVVFLLIWQRAHLQAFIYLSGLGILAVLPLLDRRLRYLALRFRRSFHRSGDAEQTPSRTEVGSYAWRGCYVLSVLLLLLLVGVLTPMALFRASLNVERRLGVKQAQLHLASALDRRLMSTRERCRTDEPGVDELGVDACNEFKNQESEECPENEKSKEGKNTLSSKIVLDPPSGNIVLHSPWRKIVLDPLFPAGGKLPVCPHSLHQKGGELYSGWFQNLVYVFHHDYNQTAAEMLGVIPDRVESQPGNSENSDSTSSPAGTTERMNAGSGNPADKEKPFRNFPEWFWDNDGSTMTLRWHGVHSLVPRSNEVKTDSDPVASSAKESNEAENDLLITSNIPVSSWGDTFAGVAVAAAVIVAIGLIVRALARRIFLFHVAPLKMTGALRLAEAIREGRNVLILVPPVPDWHLEVQKETKDLEKIATGPKWAENLNLDEMPVNTVIEIQHFEHGLNDPELNSQKLILLLRLLGRENTQLAAVMKVPPSSEDYGRMFPTLEVIDLREEPFYWLQQYEGPARDLIWKECGAMPALWPIGAQLAKDIKTENVHSEETITSEILERADGYYRLVWRECSDDQKFALAQLAEDGLLNPTNARAIRQLVRRGLITTNPQFRLMNESFRRFVRSATSAGLTQEWLRESRRSGWGKVHGAFFTTMILLGAFLLTTQNALWQSSAAYVTTALGALGTLAKLFNTYRGGGTTEKAG
jgi:hypothetical protein